VNTFIDIRNNAEVHEFIIAKLTRIGWKIDANAKVGNILWSSFPNKTARLFILGYQHKGISWQGDSDCVKYENITSVVETMEDARQLMEFVEENADLFFEGEKAKDETFYLKMLAPPDYPNKKKYVPAGGKYYDEHGLKPEDYNIQVGGSQSGKSLYQAAIAAAKLKEVADKCDTVIGLGPTSSVTPPKSLYNVTWDMDALDAKMDASIKEKMTAILNKSAEGGLDKFLKKQWTDYYYYNDSPFAKLFYGEKDGPMDVGGAL
jgi:hypothetical protein